MKNTNELDSIDNKILKTNNKLLEINKKIRTLNIVSGGFLASIIIPLSILFAGKYYYNNSDIKFQEDRKNYITIRSSDINHNDSNLTSEEYFDRVNIGAFTTCAVGLSLTIAYSKYKGVI